MSILNCDISHWLQYFSIAFTVAALMLAWFDKAKPSIMCLGVSVLMQIGVTSLPSCASIFDPRGVPIIGAPQR